MGRGLRVFHNVLPGSQPNQGQSYSLVLEQRGKQEVLLLENYAIVSIGNQEYEGMKKLYSKLTDAYGCLGILRINAGEVILHFLVVVTGCTSAGKIGTSEVYRVTNVNMISLRGYQPDEEKVAEIRKLICCGTFYFAWANEDKPIDLTLAAQKAVKYETTDNRFFWNRMMYIPFVRYDISPDEWLLKLMCGSVEVRTVYVGSRQAKAAVISRLSCERAGTRFQVRGVDDAGHVANFAETEQVIYMGDEISSFVQIRGSVPLFWEQPGVNVGSHKIKMSRGPELSQTAFDLHLKYLKSNYGHQAIVNLLGSSLVGSKEGEATLSTAFQTHHKLCEQHLDTPHVLFDYHQEVKSGNVKNLAKLKAKVQKYVEKFGFFTKKGSDVTRQQYGTVRTNCTDCLDRTNCVQTFLGLEVLQFSLMDLGLTDKPNIVSRFEELFRQMWINNGNELSKMYAGTGALQGGSKLIDGARSAARTIQNNLLDNTKQESIDVLLFGSSFNSDLADRARMLLPPNYINAPRPALHTLVQRYSDYTEPSPLRVAIGTYNINGGKHFRSIVFKDVSLSDWLLDAHKTDKQSVLIDLSESDTDERKRVDVYAIGFEEMVDLDAKNIVNASSENAKGWASELTKILNRDEKFVLVTYLQLVGVCLYVFVRPELAPHIRDVAVDSVKTGMGGATGNKGAVAIRFRYHSTSLCFVCSHFAAGQSAITDRNNDFNEAVKKIMFPMGRTLLGHDYVFWCGDFNYRINMGREDVVAAVKNQDWQLLLSADQLKIEHLEGNVFEGFQEGDIGFPPTYKYDLFSDDYDTSEKCRVPAWTDRVLWRRRQLHKTPPPEWSAGKVFWYGRAELKQSDHRPVLAIIDVEVLQVNKEKREVVFQEALKQLGPPDGSVLLQFENLVAPAIQEVMDDHFMQQLQERLKEIGELRFIKYIHEMIWVAFADYRVALEAVELGTIEVCGHEMTFRLKNPDWRDILDKELDLCSAKTIPLCEVTELNLRKESARLLSQLSQLSFEELGDITMPDTTEEEEEEEPPPVMPPPPRPGPPSRPAAPPSRPAAPPSRPSAPPGRPAAPPAKPPPPKTSPLPPKRPPLPPAPAPAKKEDKTVAKQDSSDKAGFSDIFAVTSPVESDLPISSSSGSLVALAKSAGTPAASDNKTPSSSSSSNSLNYPEGYDPLAESGKAWTNGTDQTIPDDGKPTVPAIPTTRPVLPPRQPSKDSSAGSTPSGPSTPKREMLPTTKRGPPPPLPGRPTGPPPTLPTRPPAGPPPPLPKR